MLITNKGRVIMNKKKFRVTAEVFYSFDSSYGIIDLTVNAVDQEDAEMIAVERIKVSYGYDVTEITACEVFLS